MTLIVAAAYSDGTARGLAVAADRRVTHGDGSYSDGHCKLFPGANWIAAHYGAVTVPGSSGVMIVGEEVDRVLRTDGPTGATAEDAAQRVANVFDHFNVDTDGRIASHAGVIVFGFDGGKTPAYTVVMSGGLGDNRGLRPLAPLTEATFGDVAAADVITGSPSSPELFRLTKAAKAGLRRTRDDAKALVCAVVREAAQHSRTVSPTADERVAEWNFGRVIVW